MHPVIPTLDWQLFTNGSAQVRASFISSLKEALSTRGFFFLKNHTIPEKTLSLARSVFDAFFALPEETRLAYEYKEEYHQRGYTPLRLEKGEFSSIADEKHFFQVGEDRPVTVAEIPGFTETTTELFCAFQQQARGLLGVISLSLDLTESFLPKREGNSIMRGIDYPPTDTPLADDGIAAHGGNITGMCATKHTDINIITLLEAKEQGLQLLDGDQWIPITIHDPSLIVVNAGDMLEHLTGGRYKSGLHRVVCQRNVRRFSIPFFCHVHEHVSIKPLSHLIGTNRDKYPFDTAGEFLHHRLAQIGL